MPEVAEMTREEIEQKINSASSMEDINFLNEMISGNIKPVEQVTPTEEPIAEDVGPEHIDEVVAVEDSDISEEQKYREESFEFQRESEELKRKLELIEIQKEEERQQRINAQAELNAKLEEEAKLREELQKKIEELRNAPKEDTRTQAEIEEDDSYVTDYDRNTRKKIEELSKTLGTSSPVIEELRKELDEFRNMRKENERQDQLKRETREREEARNRLYDDVRKFQKKYPEFNTKEDIGKMTDKFLKFKEDVSWALKTTDSKTITKALNEYFKEDSETRKTIESKGIRLDGEFDKFRQIADLIDLKNGAKYNEITGEIDYIRDDFGNRVNYRSLDEAYKISNYHNEINKARVNGVKEVTQKLEKRSNVAVTVPVTAETRVDHGAQLTKDTISELLNLDPYQLHSLKRTDPSRYELAMKAYDALGVGRPN